MPSRYLNSCPWRGGWFGAGRHPHACPPLLLRGGSSGEPIDLSGMRVAVLGGGNVALDTARTVLRLGASEVRMACLEPRGEMPGFQWEVGVAEAESVAVLPGRTFKEVVVKYEQVVGVRCVEVEFRGFKRGRPDS